MKARELKPIRERPEDFEAIERALVLLFRREIYLPLMREIAQGKRVVLNSYDDLIDAISSGQIQYVRDHFEGSFNAAISRELRRRGAEWNDRGKWWSFPKSELTADMRSAIALSESRMQQMAQAVDKKLASILPEQVAEKLSLKTLIDTTIFRANRKFEENVKGITVAPKLTQEQADRLSAEYTQNMQLYIQEWTESEITKLRKQIQQRSVDGFRYESMVKAIQKSYDVSQNKAKFLARQETSLMLTKFAQVRYQSAGVNEYRWRCVAGSAQHPVRPMHKALDGKIFAWDNPPVVNEKGERKNPGQDFGCRCTAIPIVRF